AAARDQHLASCTLCRKTLDSLRTTAQTLADPAVWDPIPISTTPRPDTLAFLRGMQKSMADEDAQAAVWIKELLAGPREMWAPRLVEHPEWRTGGMVRRLNEASEATVATTPEDALAMAGLGIEIFVADAQHTTVLRRFGALSYYHHGYALWYT